MRKDGLRSVSSSSLASAIENGQLTRQQLKELIALEARELGLGYQEAVRRAKAGRLPRNHIGADLELLVGMLAR